MENTMNDASLAGNFGFMWGMIPVILVIVLAVQMKSLLQTRAYRKIVIDFMEGRHGDLEERVEKLRRQLGPDRKGRMRKKNAEPYNNLCHILASMALLRGEDDAFLDRISEIEYAEEYALRPFTLALYYLSKQQPSVAEEHYYDFKACSQKDWSMGIVMDRLFDPMVEQGEEDLPDALNLFRNPATLYLLEQVGLLEDEEEDEEEYEEDEEYEEYEYEE